jgi:hypothetical protein
MPSRDIKYVVFFLMTVLFMACENRQPAPQDPTKDLTVVFATTSGMIGDAYNELILRGVMESVKAHPDISLHLLKPDSLGEAGQQIKKWLQEADPTKALILCGPEFETVITETDSTTGRILLLDCNPPHRKGVSTALLKRYGGGWLAGAMIHELKMLLIKGLNGDRIIDAISSGIEDGYRENNGVEYQVVVLAEGYEGLSMIDEAFSLITHDSVMGLGFTNGVFVPVCGMARLGTFSFSQNYYRPAIGIGEDCAIYSDNIPFSLIYDIGGIVNDYINRWCQDKAWPEHETFGLATGHVRITYNERFYSSIGAFQEWTIGRDDWRTMEAQFTPTALEKEVSHVY